MKELQDIINKRAESKLKSEISALSHILYSKNKDILDGIRVNIGTHEVPKTIELRLILEDSALGVAIFNKNIERYKEKETAEFLQKVENLQGQIDDLMNNQNPY